MNYYSYPLYSVCFLVWSICSVQTAQQLYEGDSCDQGRSKCENLKNCSILHDDVNKGKRPPLCGFKDKDVIVCCSSNLLYKFSDDKQSISVDACKWYKDEVCPQKTSTTPTPAPQKELEEQLPFLSWIGYGVKNKIIWACGGVLISRRYVLSTAHCSYHKARGKANWVLFKNDDYKNLSNIYKISAIFNHPDYHPPAQYNDIALYRLDRKVKFTELVRPICLPQVFADYEYYNFVYGAGWIIQGTKPVSVSNMLKFIPSGSCAFAGTAEQIPDGTDGFDTMCVNGYDDFGSYNCSKKLVGGPFFAKESVACDSGTLLGVLSIGKICNERDLIGIYTNVTHFKPWIESIVWPENSTYIEILWNN